MFPFTVRLDKRPFPKPRLLPPTFEWAHWLLARQSVRRGRGAGRRHGAVRSPSLSGGEDL